MKKKIGVYQIVNLVNGKVYVGSTSHSIQHRWNCHRSELDKGIHHSLHLQRAWDSYGASFFSWQILEECAPTECITREQFWIDKLKSANFKFGYNISPTANSPLGCKHSAEFIAANSKRAKVRWKDPEYRARLTKSIRKSSKRPEVRKKISKGNVRRFSKPEERLKVSIAADKRWKSKKERQKMSATQSKLWSDPNYKKKMVKIRRETHNTPELKERFSNNLKAKWSDPIYRAKMVLAQRRRREREAKEKSNGYCKRYGHDGE